MSNSGILSTPSGNGAYIKVNENNTIICSSEIITPNGTINKHGELTNEENLKELLISGTTNEEYGAFLSLKRVSDPSLSGGFVLGAVTEKSSSITETKLVGHNTGHLCWNEHDITTLLSLSNKSIDFTVGASGSTYISPGSGIWMLSSLDAQQLQIYNTSCDTLWYTSENLTTTESTNRSVCVPAKLGDVIQIYYTANSFRYFRFIFNVYDTLLPNFNGN